jgi:hypothetical protein
MLLTVGGDVVCWDLGGGPSGDEVFEFDSIMLKRSDPMPAQIRAPFTKSSSAPF